MWAGGEHTSEPFIQYISNKTDFVNHVSFDIDVAPLLTFLKEIEEGTIVMMASFDDPSTK